MKRFCVAFAGILAFSLPLQALEKVIFDTDMGGDVDDAIALAYLLSEPECDLVGVTVEAWGGNGPRQAEIVSALCRDQGRDVEIAIGPGAGNVLGRRAPKTPAKPPRYWPIVQGRDHREFTARNDAVDFIRRTVRANPGEVTILATGQFTNLSALFAVDPELPSLLKRLVIMGGNLKGTSEWNAEYDPVATAVVFANGNHARPPATLVIGAELTTPHHLPTAEARRFFAGIPRLELCAEAAEYWLKDFHALYFHDPIAAVAVFHPEIATWTNSTVAVDVLNGRTTFEAKANPEHGPLQVATKIDFCRFKDLFLSVMKRPRTTTPAAPTFTDEWDYLKRKWREDVSDPSTGLAAPALRAEIEKAMPKWKAELPWPDAKAKAFAFLCDRTAIDVSPYDWFPTFAYWTRHTFKLHPFWDQIGIRKGEVFAKWKFADHPYRKYWRGYPDFDHSAPDWDDVLKLGFSGMAERLKANWKPDGYYPPRQTAIDGVMRLLDRFIACGEGRLERLRLKESKGAGNEANGRLAKQVESLKRLRAGAPQTAYDALNLIYLYWVISENFEGIQVRTLGNLDRLIAPYYRADLAAGRTTEAEFRSQLRHFWWQWGSIDNYYGQPVYFGGTKADGSTEYNEVSKIMLDVHDELALATPKLHLKVGKSTPDWVWRKTIDMARRMRPISFIGEEPHARVIKSMGYTDDEAREFMVWGCYEWAIRDSANDTFGASVNLPKTIETLLADAAAGRFAPADYASFKAACQKLISAVVADARAFALEDERDLAAVNPSLLFSLATRHSVETGKDAYCGGMLHGNNTGIWMVGLASTIDSIAAVKELVYDRREMSLAELGRIMAANWKDHEPLRLRMARSKRKWGNNDPDANAIARELSGWIAKEVNGHANARGGRFKVHGHTARWHYGYGADVGATPDGRRRGEEISKNISPVMGADTEGVTALIASVANLDARDLPGDFPLDVALLPNTVAGEKGIDTMRTVIDVYFANGGLVIQFNVHDAATLRDAQKHPERYANLQVRVTGWNVRWNDIPKAEQDKFILRAENIIQ